MCNLGGEIEMRGYPIIMTAAEIEQLNRRTIVITAAT
jgi:hypothetical protein